MQRTHNPLVPGSNPGGPTKQPISIFGIFDDELACDYGWPLQLLVHALRF